MSRIGRLPVTVPAGVEVKISRSDVQVKGPKGVMQRTFSPQITIKMGEIGRLSCTVSQDPDD